jgi:hypothetical protein
MAAIHPLADIIRDCSENGLGSVFGQEQPYGRSNVSLFINDREWQICPKPVATIGLALLIDSVNSDGFS